MNHKNYQPTIQRSDVVVPFNKDSFLCCYIKTPKCRKMKKREMLREQKLPILWVLLPSWAFTHAPKCNLFFIKVAPKPP